jgi:TonB family protein
MFSQLDRGSPTQHKMLAASLVLHGFFLAWLLHSPEPRLLQPAALALGENGRVLARVYFPSKTPDDSTTNSPDNATRRYRHQRLGQAKLAWKPSPAAQKLSTPQLTSPGAQDASSVTTLSKLGHGSTAGALYGSLPGGPIYGDEIRPALPVATSDPVVYPWERPDSEGKVIIEITIDETGQIVRKTILQSMGSEIDNKCLAALDKWKFQPATHNGMPIASKQDAIFPFKSRGTSANWQALFRSDSPAVAVPL